MKISDYAVKHPAVIGIILIALVFFGVIAAFSLPRDLLANINMPEILILSVYPGASPETVEKDLTSPLEEEFSLISGVREISSESHAGYSLIFISLDWKSDVEAEKNDIRDRIGNASASLPDGIEGTPAVFELGSSSLPVYTCLIESDLDDEDLAQLIEDSLLLRFSRIPDVSAVYARGSEVPALRVRLKTAQLEAMDITALEAYAAVKRGQTSVPASDVRAGVDRLALQLSGDYQDSEDLERLPVGYSSDGTAILLGEVADIFNGTGKPEFRVFSGETNSVALDIMKRTGGDTEILASSIQALQQTIEEESGGTIRFVEVINDAETIDITLSSVTDSAWLGGLLAVLVLIVFLHDLRAAFIVSLCIPFTVMVVFILMRLRGMSLNVMTLAGITVSVGMMVDSSIVILENTVRHRQRGLKPAEAASLGAGEVGGAVLASTTTSLSVFIPILILSGLAGAILKEVSWILIFSLGASALTAVVIVPWLSARILPTGAKGPLKAFGGKFDAFFNRLAGGYRHILTLSLRNKGFIIILSVILILDSLGIVGMLGAEFMSFPDMNEFEVSVLLPSGYNLEQAQDKMTQIARLTRQLVPETEAELWYAGLKNAGSIMDNGNPSTGYGRIRLVRSAERNRSVFEIVGILNQRLPAEILDADITVHNAGLARKLSYATGGSGFRIEISGADWNNILEAAESVRLLLEADPLIGRSSLNIRTDRELLSLDLNREMIGRLAVPPFDAGANLRILFSGENAGELRLPEGSVPIIVDSNLAGAVLENGTAGRIRVRNAASTTVPYSAFSSLRRRPTVDRIPRSDRIPSAVVVGETLESDLGGISERMNASLSAASLPSGVNWRIVGAADLMGDTFRDLAGVMAISFFLVYAVMVIQFERFGQPFIIMGSVPFVIIGVALALAGFGTRLSMMSLFGVIALGGMVVNNAIVLVEFTNQLRSRGIPLVEAMVQAAELRLKPILMTTLTTILGIIPLAFSLGEGTRIYASLGQVIGGGLLTSTLITLILIPVIYVIVETRRENRLRKRGKTKEFVS